MNDYDMDITGIDHALLLLALVTHARPQGMGVFAAMGAPLLTIEKCREMLAAPGPDGTVWFDYVNGCPIKVGFQGDTLRCFDLYDRDNGRGATARIVAEFRKL